MKLVLLGIVNILKQIFLFLAIFICAGVFGIIIISINYAFLPNPGCGLDCRDDSGVWMLFSSAILFPVLWFILQRKSIALKARFKIFSGIILLVLAASFLSYVFQLHTHYKTLLVQSDVATDPDFDRMVIATRPIQSYTEAGKNLPKRAQIIKAWERCALYYTPNCNSYPRQVYVQCKKFDGFVNEADWSAFRRIPAEDLDLLSNHREPRKSSMNLCSQGVNGD